MFVEEGGVKEQVGEVFELIRQNIVEGREEGRERKRERDKDFGGTGTRVRAYVFI